MMDTDEMRSLERKVFETLDKFQTPCNGMVIPVGGSGWAVYRGDPEDGGAFHPVDGEEAVKAMQDFLAAHGPNAPMTGAVQKNPSCWDPIVQRYSSGAATHARPSMDAVPPSWRAVVQRATERIAAEHGHATLADTVKRARE